MLDHAQPETMPKGSKASGKSAMFWMLNLNGDCIFLWILCFLSKLEHYDSANGDEVDDKAKNPVVQQKGRFKVTSENFETEKVTILV